MKQSSLGASRSLGSMRPSLVPGAAHGPEATRDPWREYEERIRLAPEAGSVRGLFFRDVLRLAPQLQTSRTRYLPFSSYPMREYMSLLLAGARAVHPRLPPAQALRNIGLGVYDAFANSLAGRSLFGIIQHEYVRVLELTPKAYPVTMQPGSVEVVFESDTKAVAQLRDIWPFPESFHLGIWEGAYKALSVRGHVDAVVLGPAAVDLHLSWELDSIRGPTYSQR